MDIAHVGVDGTAADLVFNAWWSRYHQPKNKRHKECLHSQARGFTIRCTYCKGGCDGKYSSTVFVDSTSSSAISDKGA